MRLAAAFIFLATPLAAQDVDGAVNEHILPGYSALAEETTLLADAACAAEDLKPAFSSAFDAWVRVSHLRFGPSEADDRAFALAFWPDPRGSTPKTLAALISDADPVVEDAAAFGTVSVAGRGFYALEFLLFDPQFAEQSSSPYLCTLTQAITRDIAANAAAIEAGWQNHAALMTAPGNDAYRTEEEAIRQLFTALATGLEFTSQARLGRPMGTFERPRPNRAEARRSDRSLRHVVLSLEATRALAGHIATRDDALDALFEKAISQAEALDDPVFANVATPQGRIRVEALQSSVEEIRRYLGGTVAPRLGIVAGFNALDGD